MYLSRIYTILLVSVFVGFALIEAADESNKELEELYDEIFGEKASSSDPQSTLRLLKRVAEIENSTIGHVNFTVKTLLEASEFTEEKCDYLLMEAFSILLRWRDVKNVTIVPFVEHCVRGQFSLCHPRFATLFKGALGLLSDQNRKDLVILEDIFLKPTSTNDQQSRLADRKITPEELGRGIPAFIEARGFVDEPESSNSQGSIDSPSAIDSLFDRQVTALIDTCKIINVSTALAHGFYYAVLNWPSAVELFDETALEWIPRLRLCLDITFDLDSETKLAIVREAAYHVYEEHYKDKLMN